MPLFKSATAHSAVSASADRICEQIPAIIIPFLCAKHKQAEIFLLMNDKISEKLFIYAKIYDILIK